jgi:hypothetical protein
MERYADGEGFDEAANSQGKTAISQTGAAKCGAVETQNHPEAAASEARPDDSDLAEIIAAWPRLPDAVKAEIRAMVESAAQ